MIPSSYMTPKAVKGQRSAIQGRGLFAVAPIGAGEVVAINGGRIADTATLRSLPEPLQDAAISGLLPGAASRIARRCWNMRTEAGTGNAERAVAASV